MTVSLFTTPSLQDYTFSTLQSAGRLNEWNITRLGTSRLIQDNNGSVYLIEKTPAEVAGEKILRPLLDKLSDLTSYISSFIQHLPGIPSLPFAYAKEMDLLMKSSTFLPTKS